MSDNLMFPALLLLGVIFIAATVHIIATVIG